MYERLIQIRQVLKLSQSEMAKKIGLTQTGLSTIERGLSNVTEQTIIAVCSKLHISEEWFRNGTGAMFNIRDKKYDDFFSIYNKLEEPLQEFLYNVALELLRTQNKL